MAQIPINYGDTNYQPRFAYGFGITSLNDSPKGSAPVLTSAIVTADGGRVELTFNKKMKDPALFQGEFRLNENELPMDVKYTQTLKTGDSTTIILTLDKPYSHETRAAVEYISGNIASSDEGKLVPFFTNDVYNMTSRAAATVPCDIPASDYNDMYGVETETSDDGNGLNVKSIDDGDWVEYLLNVPAKGYYKLNLRVYGQVNGGAIALTSGARSLGTRSIPSESLHNWTTLQQTVGFFEGNQTFRISATKGGFKIHWLSIKNLTAVEDENIPAGYGLEQNYPNPFNPSTEIRYSISQPGMVKITVYNTLGQIVKTLENSYKNSGAHTISFNASDIGSGVYYYKVESGSFRAVKKMMVLK
jgi:hypothetical protein